MAGLGGVIVRLPRYGRLAWDIARDPAVPLARRAAVVAAGGYLVSPIDVVPGIIPFAGQLDDLLVITLAVQFALAGLRPDQRAVHLARAGLTETALERDIDTLREAARWTARRAWGLVQRASGALASLGTPLLAGSGEARRRLVGTPRR